MTKLYELSNELATIQTEWDGEVSPEIQAKLDSLQVSIEAKIEGICKFVRGLEAERMAIAEEVSRLKNRMSRLDKGIEFFHKYMKNNLDSVGIDKVKTALFNVSISDSPPKVNVTNLSDVPERFMITHVEELPDKKAILEYFRESGDVPKGIEITRGRTLRIS